MESLFLRKKWGKELEKWIWEHYKDLFKECDYPIMEDAITFFEGGFYRIYKIYVHGLNFDYSAEAFFSGKGWNKKEK